MRIKSFLRLSGVLSVPILSLAVMGIVHGMWFDPERNMERMDAELYSPPIIRYGVYYLVFATLAIFGIRFLWHSYRTYRTALPRFYVCFHSSLCSLYCFSHYLPSTNCIKGKREKCRLHFSLPLSFRCRRIRGRLRHPASRVRTVRVAVSLSDRCVRNSRPEA